MDPKQQLSNLDPKLKEAYDRVMGTGSSSSTQPMKPVSPAPSSPVMMPQNPSPAIPTTPATPAMPPAPTMVSPKPSTPPMPQPVTPPPSASSSPVTSHMDTMQHVQPLPAAQPQKVQIGATTHGFVAPGTKKKSGIPAIVYILGAIILLAAYTIFWLKIFNVPLPFPIPFLSQ